jgi:hypothetical protein
MIADFKYPIQAGTTIRVFIGEDVAALINELTELRKLEGTALHGPDIYVITAASIELANMVKRSKDRLDAKRSATAAVQYVAQVTGVKGGAV